MKEEMATMMVRRKSSLSAWPLFAAAAVVLFPYTTHRQDFRGTIAHGLSLAAHKSSPAYGAFEDLRENYAIQPSAFPVKTQLLQSGEVFDMRVARQMAQQRQIVMKGLTIRAPDQLEPATMIAASPKAGFELKRPLASNVAEAFAVRSRPQATRFLPLREQSRLRIVEELKSEDWTQPTVGQLARELVEQDVRDNYVTISPKSLASAGTSVEKHQDGYSRTLAERRIARNDPPAPPDQELPIDEDRQFSNLASYAPNPSEFRPMVLTGQIEMTGGLAFTGSETHILVKRIYEGQSYERGRIWVTEGKFEIQVNKALGTLVAELYNTRDGRIMGRGELSLLDLPDATGRLNRIKDLRIALFPTSDGVAVRPVSGYSTAARQVTVENPRVEIESYTDLQKPGDDGVVTEASLSRESSYVARGVAKDHWSSVMVGQAYVPQDLKMLSKSLVDALVSLSTSEGRDKREAMNSSIVWGQAHRKGQPLAGAEAEMAGDYKVIYFNEAYLPDPKLTATSANGLFAFVKVKAGVQALRLKLNGKVYPAQVFPTELKHVSYVELEVRDKMISQFRIMDAMDLSKSIPAQIRLVGADEALPVSNEDFVQYSVAANPFMVEADAGVEYEISRTTVTGAPQMVYIPVVKRQWLYDLEHAKGIAPVFGRGTIVGFIDGQDFEIELTGYSPAERMQIVYFDNKGVALEGTSGVAGGGFAIFNAPIGLQTVYVHPLQSRETYSQVVVAEPRYIHVISWSAHR